MTAHLVVFEPRPDLTAAERRGFADAFARAVRAIPTVRGVRVGRRVQHGAGYEPTAPSDASYFALIEFDDLDGLQTYLRHPEHGELARLFGTALRSAWVWDYESGGIEMTAAWAESPDPL